MPQKGIFYQSITYNTMNVISFRKYCDGWCDMAEASKIKDIKFTMAKYTDVYLFKFCEPKKKD